MKYPWDSDNVDYQCLRCRRYNFEDKYGTGPFTCTEYSQGIRHSIMINEETCEKFDLLRKKT